MNKVSKSKIIKYSAKNARVDLPTRNYQDNKTRGGKCLVIAGSKGMYGSAILTCLAASRTGAGYTYLSTKGKFPIARHPDFLLIAKHPKFTDFQAIAIGPGYLDREKIKNYLQTAIKQKIKHVVLDAEALNAIATTNKKLPKTWIVTPHEGELSRILKISASAIRKDRLKYVMMAQKKLECIVLFKGYRTLIADGASVWEIQSGNPALAKAGTGDVLTGMIVAFLSQGLSPISAAKLASYIHGLIADRWIESGKDMLSLMASDIIELIPKTLFRVRKLS